MSDLPSLTTEEHEAARARTIARGKQIGVRRRASRAIGGVAAALLALVAGTAITRDADDRDVKVEAVDDGTTTTDASRRTTTTSSSTTSSITTETSAGGAPTDDAPTAGTPGHDPDPPTTETPTTVADPPTPHCETVTAGGGPRPDDWATYWQTEPAYNDPITLTSCVEDTTISAGERAVFVSSASDPDGRMFKNPSCREPMRCYLYLYPPGAERESATQVSTPTEPHPTPAESPGSTIDEVRSIQLDAPGSDQIIIRVRSTTPEIVPATYPDDPNPNSGYLFNPYQSEAAITFTITVT